MSIEKINEITQEVEQKFSVNHLRKLCSTIFLVETYTFDAAVHLANINSDNEITKTAMKEAILDYQSYNPKTKKINRRKGAK